ncbi:PH domain-containing protein [Lentibacillus saliphilus]|uniref:PH domain-containing protein n=1 Tax=Lentibacillus saliphilus TaxID=2737028 RepID=UPI001C300431|nr:PH domain-containing protein [Lentibacillus saliphilus]
MYELIEPDRRIAEDAVKVWRISNTITHLIIALIGIGLITAGYYYDWKNWIVIIFFVLVTLDVLFAIWDIFIEPVLTQRYWRYDINAEFIQIKHGIFKIHHTIAPMTKVQYVTAQQGPLLRRYGLQTLEVGTMNTPIKIPALPKEEAIALRGQIAEYAKIKEAEHV